MANLFDLFVSVGVNDNASAGIASISASSVALGNVMSQVFTKGVAIVTNFAKSAVQTGMQFDTAMSQVAATMGLTQEQIDETGGTFDQLREKALEMGASTKFTATEAAEGLNILAMAGLSAQESIEGIDTVLNLAAAGAMEMSSAATYITAAVKGFGDSMDNAEYYSDLMAKGATLANTSVAQLGEAFSAGAATASTYNQSAESLTVSLLRLAEQNVTGSTAATALNRAMADLYTPTEEGAKALTELGVATYDETGNARNLNDVVGDLNAAMSGMSQEERNAYAATIFTARGLQAFNKMSVSTTEKVEEFRSALADASGSTMSQAATQIDNLEGDVTILNSAMDGLKIAISDGVTPALRRLVQSGTSSVQSFTAKVTANAEKITDALITIIDFVDENGDEITVVLTGVATAVGVVELSTTKMGLAVSAAATQTAAMTVGMDAAAIAAQLESGSISALSVVFGVLTGKVSLATAAQLAFNAAAALASAPIVGVAAGVAAVATVFVSASKKAKGLAASIKEAGKQKVIGDDENASLEEAETHLNRLQHQYEAAQVAYEKLNEEDPYATIDPENETVNRMQTLRSAVEQQKEVVEQMRAESEAAITAAAEEASVTTELYTAGITSMQESLESLIATYSEVYDAAYDSITGQFGLFEEVPDLVKTSTTDMISALQEQTVYMQTYSENLQRLAEAGITDGLLSALSDGSTESAGYVQSIVDNMQSAADGGAEVIASLNAAYEENQAAAEEFAGVVAEQVTGFSEQMDNILGETAGMVEGLDQNQQAYDAMASTIDGAIEAATTEGTALNSALVSIANSALASFYAALGAGDPSSGGGMHNGGGHASVSASGIDYVPTNGYLAYLHKGETVLPRNEADAYRSGNAGGGSSVNIYTQSIDEATIDYILQRVNVGLVGA